uniref:Uncharacterized protein n=1 Tax=Arundo donax TaxID=35708 RepID=A0A0A9FIU3_ARUDO
MQKTIHKSWITSLKLYGGRN